MFLLTSRCKQTPSPLFGQRNMYLLPSGVERGDVVCNGETEVGNGHQDWQSELANQQTDQARLHIQI